MFRLYCVLLAAAVTGFSQRNLINGLNEINRNVSIITGTECHILFEFNPEYLSFKAILFKHVFNQQLTEYILEL